MPALSKQQQKLFGLALAVKRGDVPKSKVSDEIKDIIKKMSEKDIKKFAKTKHKGLPLKKEYTNERLDLKKLSKKFLKKRIFFKDLKGNSYEGIASYIGINPIHGKLQITVDRAPIWPVDVKSIKIQPAPKAMFGKFKTFSRNEMEMKELSENVSAEQLIDIIDLDPSNKRYDKYKKMLKDLHDIDYVEPKIRYKKEVAIIKKYDNTKFNTKTNKGIDVTVVVKKIPNLIKSLSVEAYDELGNIVGRAGFSIDGVSKTIRIGGATVNSSMRRKGIYSTIVDYIQKVARENKLKIVDQRPGSKYSGRSADAIAFWKNRMESLINKIDEKWSDKYKRSIDCNNPKGFSQKAHCKGKR